MWTDEFMELTLLNECIRCLSACGQCKFDVVHAHTSIHRHTHVHAHTHLHKSDRPISPGKFGTKSNRVYKGGSIHRFESVWHENGALYVFRPTMRICRYNGRLAD